MDPGSEITQMVEAAAASAERMGLVPYYLYRQKNIAGNFENVGYAEQDKAGVYNILIMEEMQSIVALGAGASTKKYHSDRGQVSRIENVKSVTDYISRVDEMIERLEYDILYYENMSLILDITILIYTVKTVFTGKGI